MSERTFCDIATDSCLVSEESFCKFLTANDSGANKSHQAGILVSTTAMRMIFGKSQMVILQPKKTVKISWNNEIMRIAQYRITQFVLGDHLVYN